MPQTNADRIRSMSDEELCSFLLYKISQTKFGTKIIEDTLVFTENDMLVWLNSPACAKEGE